jgi:serine-type D-Ala-D-Ala carboxypeptidase/endopeptidase (penicillin-binding protein 4)
VTSPQLANGRADAGRRTSLVRLKPDATYAAVVLVAVTVAGCHPQVRLQPGATPKGTVDLRRTIDGVLNDPALSRGYWGVLVKSLKSGDTLYELNARKLFIPASNMKIVTLAAAAERLGWDFTYETRLLAAGRIADGRLDGDLVVVGSGDPSIVTADGVSDRVFDDWASKLLAAGVRTVSGRVIGDDNTFDDEELGFGWSWDDLPDDYAAGVSALQFNENAVRLTIAPGAAAGDFAAISLEPVGSGLIVDSEVRTGPADAPVRIAASRLPGSDRLVVRGSIPKGGASSTRLVSVDNPTAFFANVLRRALIARGIDVRGPAVDIDLIADPPAGTGAASIASHRSAPLSQLAVRLMKISQNLYAETLLKSIAAATGTPTFMAGRTQVQTTLQAWGVEASDLIDRDGSGLSRYDYVSPAALVTILTHISRDERLRDPFVATLPIAGRDGSLSNRMKSTAAENNARAKTGSMSNVRTLSGYVTAADGEPLVFSIMANNFDTPPDTINKAADAIVVKLATFKRP